MRNTRFLSLGLVLALFLMLNAGFAQDNGNKDGTKQDVKTYKLTADEQATKITDKLNKKLNLTPDQYAKIQKLYADNISYRRELRNKDLISKSEIKQKQKDFREGIKNTLTDEQKGKMKNMMKKNQKKHRKHHRHGF